MNWRSNKINDSDCDDAECNPSSYAKVATYTTNRKISQKLFNNRFISKIIPGAILPIYQLITEDVPGIRENLDVLQMVLLKEIVTDTAWSGTRILQTPRGVSRTGRDGSMPRGVNTAVATTILTSPFKIFKSTSEYPTRTGTQNIFNSIGPAGPQCIRNTQKLKTSINVFWQKYRSSVQFQ